VFDGGLLLGCSFHVLTCLSATKKPDHGDGLADQWSDAPSIGSGGGDGRNARRAGCWELSWYVNGGREWRTINRSLSLIFWWQGEGEIRREEKCIKIFGGNSIFFNKIWWKKRNYGTNVGSFRNNCVQYCWRVVDVGASSSSIPGNGARKLSWCLGWCYLFTVQLGTPRGRYDEYSSKVFPQLRNQGMSIRRGANKWPKVMLASLRQLQTIYRAPRPSFALLAAAQNLHTTQSNTLFPTYNEVVNLAGLLETKGMSVSSGKW
jgi:hypothetical protein